MREGRDFFDLTNECSKKNCLFNKKISTTKSGEEYFVESERIELSSKQVTKGLSTRLVF